MPSVHVGNTEHREPRTLDELLSHRAATMPDAPIAAFPTSAAPDSYQRHTARQLDEYATRAAHRYREAFGQRERNTPPHVVAARKATQAQGRLVRYVMTVAGPEPADEVHHALDREHYVAKQVRPVAEPVLATLGLDFEQVIGDRRQLDLLGGL